MGSSLPSCSQCTRRHRSSGSRAHSSCCHCRHTRQGMLRSRLRAQQGQQRPSQLLFLDCSRQLLGLRSSSISSTSRVRRHNPPGCSTRRWRRRRHPPRRQCRQRLRCSLLPRSHRVSSPRGLGCSLQGPSKASGMHLRLNWGRHMHNSRRRSSSSSSGSFRRCLIGSQCSSRRLRPTATPGSRHI